MVGVVNARDLDRLQLIFAKPYRIKTVRDGQAVAIERNRTARDNRREQAADQHDTQQQQRACQAHIGRSRTVPNRQAYTPAALNTIGNATTDPSRANCLDTTGIASLVIFTVRSTTLDGTPLAGLKMRAL